MVTISQRRSPPDCPEYDGPEASRLAMVETTSLREEKPKLSARDRLCLIQTINALPPTQFDELVFSLDPPNGVVASNTAPQGQRSKELLDWLKGSTGPGLVAADEILQVLIPKATKTAPQPVAFAISGKMGDLPPSELEAIVELLRQKTGDDSLFLAFSREGSIKLILNGSPEGLAKLQEMFEAGELEQLGNPPVEAVAPVDRNSEDARKARLIQALRLSCITRINGITRVAYNNIIGAQSFSFASTLDFARGLVRDLDRALNRTVNRALALDDASTSALIIAVNRESVLDIERALASDDIAKDIESSLELVNDLKLKLTNALVNALELELVKTLELVNALELAHKLALDLRDLSNADLSGANLKDLILVGANLTDADITNADVTGTRLGNNLGLSDADKRDLQRRGAIILDPPSSDVPTLGLR